MTEAPRQAKPARTVFRDRDSFAPAHESGLTITGDEDVARELAGAQQRARPWKESEREREATSR